MDNTKKSDKTIYIIASFLFLMLIWGSSFILIKQGLGVFSPIEVASIRLASAMVAMLPLVAVHIRKVPKEKWKHLIISAIVAMGAPAYFFAFAQTPGIGINSSIAGVLNALTPLMTFVMGVLFFQQEITTNKVIGLIVGFLGSATLILVNSKGQLSINAFAFFIIAATFCYGINVNYVKKYLSDIPSLQLSSITVFLVGIFSSLVLCTTDFIQDIQTNPVGQIAFFKLMILGVLGTALAQVVFNKMLSMTSALVASSITYFIPIVAVLWGLLDGEILLGWHYLGMALIIGGVLILNGILKKF